MKHIRVFTLIGIHLLCGCMTTNIRTTPAAKAANKDLPPVKMIVVTDGVVITTPRPEVIDGGSAHSIVTQVSNACEQRLLKEVNVSIVGRIETVGNGLVHTKKYLAQKDELSGIDSIAPPYHVNSTIDSGNDDRTFFFQELCSVALKQINVSEYGMTVGDYLSQWKVKEQLVGIKKMTGADYCFFTTVKGTIRRQPISTGVRAAATTATYVTMALVSPIAALARLSQTGGVELLPGDETSIILQSYLINLSSGKVVWSKRYLKHELYAVEYFKSKYWVAAVFKKFRRDRL